MRKLETRPLAQSKDNKEQQAAMDTSGYQKGDCETEAEINPT